MQETPGPKTLQRILDQRRKSNIIGPEEQVRSNAKQFKVCPEERFSVIRHGLGILTLTNGAAGAPTMDVEARRQQRRPSEAGSKPGVDIGREIDRSGLREVEAAADEGVGRAHNPEVRIGPLNRRLVGNRRFHNPRFRDPWCRPDAGARPHGVWLSPNGILATRHSCCQYPSSNSGLDVSADEGDAEVDPIRGQSGQYFDFERYLDERFGKNNNWLFRTLATARDVPRGGAQVQVGMFFELQLPRPWADGDELRLFQNALEWAEIGDRIGVSHAWAQEHHFLEEYSHSTAPEVFLAAISQRTKRMRIGHGIALMPPAYNHPARVAERLATLDLVSEGRVEWGTGESSSRVELEGFEINYVDKRAMWAEGIRETARMMASEPYPGHSGKFFSMPARNIVPKPVQKPHPPAWIACTNRDTLKLAARLGLGALTFAFMDAAEARFWVEEYYEIFRNDCSPITQSVNPNVAMLAGVMCHRDGDVAKALGTEGQRFFKWALAHYYRTGVHIPGGTNLWELFQKSTHEPMAGLGGVGDPEEVSAHFKGLEDAGVDQVIMLQQAGQYRHEDICASLELLGETVLPPIIAAHDARSAAKRAALEPYVAKALSRVSSPIGQPAQPVEAYPLHWEQNGAGAQQVGSKRAVDAAAMWRLHVGSASDRK